MKAFAPQTDTFLPLHIIFPEDSVCCLYEHNHLLVVHSETYICKFAVEGQITKRSQVSAPSFDKDQNSQSIIDEANGVIYMIMMGNVFHLR